MKVGDRVQALDDDFEGIVSSINDGEIGVKDEDGFVIFFRESELITINSDDLKPNMLSVPDAILKEKEEPRNRSVEKVPIKQRNAPTFEVDLHIHKLVDTEKGLSNYDILNIQLDTARRQLDFAIAKRIPKMVFIHGVGQGVLREELYTLLRRYDHITFYDANFQKYGVGATEVYIYQNAVSS